MFNNLYNCSCGEGSSNHTTVRVSKIILQDPENSNIQFEIYVKDGEMYHSKVVSTSVETSLYNTSND